jgi:predicted metalloprotease with PDZ domain
MGPSSNFRPPSRTHHSSAYAFDLGFDDAASRESKAVAGVRADGPAYAAGLRDGQRLVSYSLMYGQSEHKAEFTIEENEERRKIAYYPRGAATTVPAYRER